MSMLYRCALGLAAGLVLASSASAITVSASDPSGLAAEAQFTITGPAQLTVRLKNTSTGNGAFTGAAAILTGISWDFGLAGVNGGDNTILGGTITIGAMSQSVNFSTGSYGAGTDVGGEWGYGNNGTGLSFPNLLSALQSGTTAFGGANLDNPANLDGPQGGLIASATVSQLGGLGAIRDEVVAVLNLSQPIANLNFITQNNVRFEFGSDALFLTTPTPGSAAGVLLGGAILARRRRK
ncbi:MAG: hypothetical protein K2W85_04715 [Phycisphaerales bacterium]|nr:hypothetical protein [Phycisphaerales bacterium]